MKRESFIEYGKAFKEEPSKFSMANDRTRLVMGILVFIIVVLAGVIIYSFVIQPAVNDYVLNKQVSAYNQGQSDLLLGMLQQIQQTGIVRIPIGNQTLVLAPVQTQPQQIQG